VVAGKALLADAPATQLAHPVGARSGGFVAGLHLEINLRAIEMRRDISRLLATRLSVPRQLPCDLSHHLVGDVKVSVDLLDVVVLFEGVDETQRLLRGRGV
jgi:hypothetical protein